MPMTTNVPLYNGSSHTTLCHLGPALSHARLVSALGGAHHVHVEERPQPALPRLHLLLVHHLPLRADSFPLVPFPSHDAEDTERVKLLYFPKKKSVIVFNTNVFFQLTLYSV